MFRKSVIQSSSESVFLIRFRKRIRKPFSPIRFRIIRKPNPLSEFVARIHFPESPEFVHGSVSQPRFPSLFSEFVPGSVLRILRIRNLKYEPLGIELFIFAIVGILLQKNVAHPEIRTGIKPIRAPR